MESIVFFLFCFFRRGFIIIIIIIIILFDISPKYIMKYLDSQICVSKHILHHYRLLADLLWAMGKVG